MNRRTLLQITGASLVTGLASVGAQAAQTTEKGQNMLIVTFEVEFEDGAIHDHLDAIRAMDAETAKETGCITYKTSFDASNPNIMRIYEMWDSMEALVPHFQTPHMAAFQTALAGLKSKRMQAKVYEVAQELPFPNG